MISMTLSHRIVEKPVQCGIRSAGNVQCTMYNVQIEALPRHFVRIDMSLLALRVSVARNVCRRRRPLSHLFVHCTLYMGVLKHSVDISKKGLSPFARRSHRRLVSMDTHWTTPTCVGVCGWASTGGIIPRLKPGATCETPKGYSPLYAKAFSESHRLSLPQTSRLIERRGISPFPCHYEKNYGFHEMPRHATNHSRYGVSLIAPGFNPGEVPQTFTQPRTPTFVGVVQVEPVAYSTTAPHHPILSTRCLKSPLYFVHIRNQHRGGTAPSFFL